MKAQENKLIYVGDPMCSWCYGFGPELDKVRAHFPQLGFQLVLGGLRPHGTEKMDKLGNFLKGHWDHVKDASGQKFSYEILKDPDFVYDTEPACRAVETARSIKSEISLDFYHAVQKVFYAENQDTSKVETYAPLLEEFGINPELFAQMFDSEEMKKNTQADFELSASMGIRGFPSMVAQKGEEYFLLTRGYQKADALIGALKQLYGQVES